MTKKKKRHRIPEFVDRRDSLEVGLTLLDHMKLAAYIRVTESLEHQVAKDFFKMLVAAEDTELGSVDAYTEVGKNSALLSPTDQRIIEDYLVHTHYIKETRQYIIEEDGV